MSQTTYYNLTKPLRGSTGWTTSLNTNSDLVDAALAALSAGKKGKGTGAATLLAGLNATSKVVTLALAPTDLEQIGEHWVFPLAGSYSNWMLSLYPGAIVEARLVCDTAPSTTVYAQLQRSTDNGVSFSVIGDVIRLEAGDKVSNVVALGVSLNRWDVIRVYYLTSTGGAVGLNAVVRLDSDFTPIVPTVYPTPSPSPSCSAADAFAAVTGKVYTLTLADFNGELIGVNGGYSITFTGSLSYSIGSGTYTTSSGTYDWGMVLRFNSTEGRWEVYLSITKIGALVCESFWVLLLPSDCDPSGNYLFKAVEEYVSGDCTIPDTDPEDGEIEVGPGVTPTPGPTPPPTGCSYADLLAWSYYNLTATFSGFTINECGKNWEYMNTDFDLNLGWDHDHYTGSNIPSVSPIHGVCRNKVVRGSTAIVQIEPLGDPVTGLYYWRISWGISALVSWRKDCTPGDCGPTGVYYQDSSTCGTTATTLVVS